MITVWRVQCWQKRVRERRRGGHKWWQERRGSEEQFSHVPLWIVLFFSNYYESIYCTHLLDLSMITDRFCPHNDFWCNGWSRYGITVLTIASEGFSPPPLAPICILEYGAPSEHRPAHTLSLLPHCIWIKISRYYCAKHCTRATPPQLTGVQIGHTLEYLWQSVLRFITRHKAVYLLNRILLHWLLGKGSEHSSHVQE